jgi:predicted phosphodiesterase
VRTVILSDLHLGAGGNADLLRRPHFREVLLAELDGADQVVLLGDAIELRDRPLGEALELARPLFEEVASLTGRLVVVPGNHDHHLLAAWLERRRLDGAEPLGLEQRLSPESGPLAALAKRLGGTEVELAYPGLWLRPDVYATHGHYLDRHLTIPTFERLAVAAVERMLDDPAARDDPLAPPPEAEPDGPDAYERIQAPVYAFLFALAQGAVDERSRRGSGPSARVWQALGGGYGRAAKLRGWLLGTVALPGAVRVANRLGLGPVKADLSPGTITRAGLAAMGEVASRLGIEAEHIVFGHTHRRGPREGERGWAPPAGARLWNTGSWVYSPGLLGRTAAESPYWPGTIAVVEDDGEPQMMHLLDALSRAELRGRAADPDEAQEAATRRS